MENKRIIIVGVVLVFSLTALFAFSSELRHQTTSMENEDIWSETPVQNNDGKIVSGSTSSKTFHQDNPVNDIWFETSDDFEKNEQMDTGASHIKALHTEKTFDDESYNEAGNLK
jgi:hypothetical protein